MQSRREFIESFTRYAGASALFGSLPWISVIKAEEITRKPTSKIKLAVVGTGSRGQLLLRHLLNNPHVEIAGLCDNYKPHLDAALRLMPQKTKEFSDYRRLFDIKGLQAIINATPPDQHAPVSIDAMKAGLHVFCEKSMALTMDECKKMLLTHRATGKILQIGHQRMFNIKYIRAIELIKQGRIGVVTHLHAYWHRNNSWRRPIPHPSLEQKLNWRLYKKYSAGLMTELACHQLQVANWIMNAYPECVTGMGSIAYWKDGREVDDNVNLVYRYPGAIHLVYDSNISNAHYGVEERIMGTKGTMELEKGNGRLFSEKPPAAPGILQLMSDIEKKIYRAVPIGGPSWAPETLSEDKGEYIIDTYPLPDDVKLQLEAFTESVKSAKPIPRMAEHGYHSGIAALLGYQAIEEKRIVYWPDEYKL